MRVFLLAIVTVLLLISCRTTRKTTTVMAQNDTAIVMIDPNENDSVKNIKATFDSIQNRRIIFSTFSSKVKVKYKDNNAGSLDLNAFLRMKKDSAIWLSVIFPIFNNEVVRVIITPDSITIINKFKRYVQQKPLSYLQDIAQLPFDFSTLEDLIIGNPIYLEKTIDSYHEHEGNISISTVGKSFKNNLTISKADLQLLFSKLIDIDLTRSRAANLSYAEYLPIGTRMFASARNISLSEKNNFDVLLNFLQIEFDKPLTFPFSIPKNYNVVN